MVRIFFDEFDDRRSAQDLFDGRFDVRQIRQKGTQNRFRKVKPPMRGFAKPSQRFARNHRRARGMMESLSRNVEGRGQTS
jgi:hypothetical protein